jgi:hypothetical protein
MRGGISMMKISHSCGHSQIEPMIWKPGVGPDTGLIEQLCRTFGLPKTPLGEAWFMGDNRFIYEQLSAQGLANLSAIEVEDALYSLTSGLFFFADRPEWSDWFGYLIPRLLREDIGLSEGSPRYSHSTATLALMGLSLRNAERSAARSEGTFATVISPWIMSSRFWRGDTFMPLRSNTVWLDSWGESGFDTTVCASLFLIWRTLRPEAFHAWVESILSIEDPYWRAHFLIWLGNMLPVFEAGVADLSILMRCNILEMWPNFSTIEIAYQGSPDRQDLKMLSLIPHANIEAMRHALQQEMGTTTYLRWIDEFSTDATLWPQMESWLEKIQAGLFPGANAQTSSEL